jgi:broad specificity phosphatase PhoE
MSSLILMRHGQALFGHARYDALSPTGQAQASSTGQWLAAQGQTLTSLWQGPRQRQRETAALCAQAAGWAMAVQEHAGLNEFAEGEDILAAASTLMGQPMQGPGAPAREVQLRAYDAALQAWVQGRVDMPGRPDYARFRHSALACLRALMAHGGKARGQRVLAVTSGGVIAAMVCEALQLPDAQWLGLLRMIDNASMTELVFSGSRCGLRSFNSSAHLPRALSTSI